MIRTRGIASTVSVFVGFVCILASAPAGAQEELVFEVAEVGQHFYFYPSELGNGGEVVGWARVDIPDEGRSVGAACVWHRGTTTPLDVDLTGNSFAEAINDDGYVLGVIYAAGEAEFDRLFLADPDGNVVDSFLDDLFEGDVHAVDISNSGQVVVRNIPAGATGFQPFLVERDSDDEWVETPLMPEDGYRGEAAALNNSGQAVGYYDESTATGFTRHPYMWDNGSEVAIGALEERASAADLNDTAQIVGSALLFSADEFRAFVSDAGGALQDLGAPAGGYSEAVAISNHGWIVGTSTTTDGASTCPQFSAACRAFVVVDAAFYDLNDLVPADLPWILTSAIDVNDSGQILVRGLPKESGPLMYLLLSPPGVDPGEPTEGLIELIESYGLPKGLENSLLTKLEKAFAAIEEDDLKRACNLFGAFMNEVEAQAGKKLTEDQAEELLEGAEAARESIGCV